MLFSLMYSSSQTNVDYMENAYSYDRENKWGKQIIIELIKYTFLYISGLDIAV